MPEPAPGAPAELAVLGSKSTPSSITVTDGSSSNSTAEAHSQSASSGGAHLAGRPPSPNNDMATIISRHIVVLACRVVLHDAFGTEEAIALAKRMHELAAAKTAQHQGYMSQRLAGTGFTVMFNYPRVIEGAEERACASAIAILEEAARLCETHPAPAAAAAKATAPAPVPIAVHIGLHCAVRAPSAAAAAAPLRTLVFCAKTRARRL